MFDMHITLLSCAAAALIALWLGMRCGRVRTKEKIAHGDGGNGLMTRRMRAQSNFVEYTPFALFLIGALELVGHGGLALAITGSAFLIGRILHALGMDSEEVTKLRAAGMALTFLPMLGLIIAAILAALRII